MPIAFSCPNCGKQMNVPDQYAGQTGPCAACGKTMTIPGGFAPPPPAGYSGVGPAAPPASKSSGALPVVLIVLVVVGIGVLGCGGVMAALLIPAVSSARQAAKAMQSSNNLKQITLAMHNYHDVYGSLPPAVVRDASGQPLYSGRVLLLPFLEQSYLYDNFDKNKAWNDPANTMVSQTVLKVFQDPSTDNPMSPASNYFFIVGPDALFPEDGSAHSFAQITDGTSLTLAFINANIPNNSWAEPVEMHQDALAAGLPASPYRQGVFTAFADGSVRALPPTTSPTDLRAMTTRNGGEPVMIP
ncbi:protein of unknown function DUF1559 [Pirellula staleyi DSM 6068]|uniref:DUF1559 domain-containing protein n=1 Tax=Pirellula staleyi (strain ATCC 27377 / DSM 6068 / ICPB 4128) TaxID=530564 RepID=D2R1E8_PIRSD|nr:DUF1559 domain-containing protein [Pirellula staleyi]ADB14933.1 protein of unknown function DUF1559 [Pirellula staleyi DSM 6068]